MVGLTSALQLICSDGRRVVFAAAAVLEIRTVAKVVVNSHDSQLPEVVPVS